MPFPFGARPGNQWLQPFFNLLEGKHPSTQQLQLGSSTGVIGLYGATGFGRLSAAAASYGTTGGAGYFSGVTGLLAPIGPSGTAMYNGGGGNFYGPNDIVRALKNVGILPQ